MQIEPLSCCCCSSELRGGGDITLEGSIVDLGSVVVQEWHHWLVHRTVPLHISWLSVSVPVHVLMVLVEDWLLSGPPLSVGIWDWWVLWQHVAQGPVDQIWVVHQCLRVEWVIVKHDWTVKQKSTATSSDAVVDDEGVGESASGVEVLDWELTDGEKSEDDSHLGLGGVAGHVEVRLVGWSGDLSALASWEPALDLMWTINSVETFKTNQRNSELIHLPFSSR